MKLYLYLLFSLISSFFYSQVQQINIGSNALYYQYYDEIGEFSPSNHPGGATRKPLIWKSGERIYLYGYGESTFSDGQSSFWVYNLDLEQWKLIQNYNVDTNFGVKGVFNDTNSPGERKHSITFSDTEGNLYLMGGHYPSYGGGGIPYNDLWKYDVQLNQWAWIGGYDNDLHNNGEIGPIGEESVDYFPPTRVFMTPILGDDGMVYFYGGVGETFGGELGEHADLWKYNPSNNSWTLLYNPINEHQNIEEVGVESPNNRPGTLLDYTSWFYDNSLWYFGGTQISTTSVAAVQNKIWRFNLDTNLWSCEKVPTSIEAIYGEQGVGNSSNTPSLLRSMSNVVVIDENAYFFGGYEPGGTTTTYNKGKHNSLWRYNMTSNEWTWLNGNIKTNHIGFYGKKGVEREENLPSSRTYALLWLNDQGNISLFGGKTPKDGDNISAQDFWEYNLTTGNFIWLNGYSDKVSNFYFSNDIETPSVYSLPSITNLKWSDYGTLWFMNAYDYPFQGETITGGMYEYDIETSRCHRIKQYQENSNGIGFYGELGISGQNNIPPFRNGASLWETETKLYLQGGQKGTSYYFNDFWVFDKQTKQWTWIGGAKYDETPIYHYSEIGVADINNYPKSRTNAQTWVDESGNLWLFSGQGINGYINDLWKYDTSSNLWVLMGGSAEEADIPFSNYFNADYPPFVKGATTWKEGNNLYFYGGYGLGKNNSNSYFSINRLNDIWRYSIDENSWSMISGDRKTNVDGNYGIQQYGFITNRPGARKGYASWSDEYGNLWLYGGYGRTENGNSSNLFDLWKFDISLNLWIWVDGINDEDIIWYDDVFNAYDYIFPRRTTNSSVTYKYNNKYYLNNPYTDSGLWEFDFSVYDLDYNIVEGNARFNINGNCTEVDMPVSNIELQVNNEPASFYTNLNGYYKIFTPVLNNSLTVNGLVDNNEYFNYTPNQFNIDFIDFNNTQSQDICLSPANESLTSGDILIVPLEPLRPGFNTTFKIIYSNKGNTIINGRVKLNYEELFMDYIESSPNNTEITNGEVVWQIDNLYPFEKEEILVTFNLNSPIDTPPLNIEDVLCFNVKLEASDNLIDTMEGCFEVINSFDPNDKMCLEGNHIEIEHVGEYVHYMIRFENVGTASATNILVSDEINTTKFDVNTIQVIESSHPYNLTNNASGMIEFYFHNINLPFDDSNNDGYVIFKIKTLDILQAGDTFENDAEIYFDYNAPIITNEFVTTVADNLNVTDIEPDNSIIKASPNPVIDEVSISSKNKVYQVKLFNSIGNLVKSVSYIQASRQKKIDLSDLSTGIYYLQILTKEDVKTIKILKK